LRYKIPINLAKEEFMLPTAPTGVVEVVENDKDEADILANQDETHPGSPNHDDHMMGAGPTDRFSNAEANDFTRGEVDVKEQMDRATRAMNFPNRAHTNKR
jgi:hypothetical protein